MPLYDIFYAHKHPLWVQNLLIGFNSNILNYLLNFFPQKKKISILEIGPGKGYFYQASKKFNKRIDYSAFDRNSIILKNLPLKSIHKEIAPKVPKLNKSFDIIYAAYVIEHLQNGEAIYELIKNCKKYLYKDGLIVFLAPDSLREKMEFWNVDITHNYPTTKRNVAMAFYDNGFSNITVCEIHGYLTHKWFTNRFIYHLLSFLLFFYNYQLMQLLISPFYKKDIYDLDNFFYQLYCFAKTKNLMFIAQKI